MTLEHFGYRVCTAADGNEAVSIFKQRRAEISALVIDLMMPFMDGAAAVLAIKREDPDIRFIMCTGITDSDKLAALRDDPNGTVLQKPHKTSDLLLALNKLLQKGASARQLKAA